MQPLISSPIDLSRVYQNRELQTHSIVRSQEFLRHSLSEHELRCGSGDIDSSLFSTSSRRLKMMVLRYGPEVEIKPHPFKGFFLVQMPLRGSSEIVSDGQRITVSQGQAAIVAPQRQIRLHWSRDCEQILLRVPMDLMQEAAASCGQPLLQPKVGAALVSPAAVIDAPAAARWAGLLQTFTELTLPRHGEASVAAQPAWMEHIEFSLALFLLMQNARHTGDEGASDLARACEGDLKDRSREALPTPLGPLAAAERYALSRLYAPIGLEDLACAAGVSSRTLHMYCKRAFGVGPMVWLRNLRLDAARRKLSSDTNCLVTDVAMDFGFGHLGRFSAYYRERFGELPRETAGMRR